MWGILYVASLLFDILVAVVLHTDSATYLHWCHVYAHCAGLWR